MIKQTDLGDAGFPSIRRLKILIDCGQIQLAGHSRLKIYGSFRCASGKRMNVECRVFFKSEVEARREGYRPCGHCMRKAYLQWKALS